MGAKDASDSPAAVIGRIIRPPHKYEATTARPSKAAAFAGLRFASLTKRVVHVFFFRMACLHAAYRDGIPFPLSENTAHFH